MITLKHDPPICCRLRSSFSMSPSALVNCGLGVSLAHRGEHCKGCTKNNSELLYEGFMDGLKRGEEIVKNMREFNTGAVRDDATGKGRFDLLPWGAIHELARHCERGALHYGERNVDKGIPQSSLIDSGLRHLALYIQGDEEPRHLIAALWNIAWAVEQELKRPEMVNLPERTEQSGSAL